MNEDKNGPCNWQEFPVSPDYITVPPLISIYIGQPPKAIFYQVDGRQGKNSWLLRQCHINI